MEAIDVITSSFSAIAKHPKYLLPQLVSSIISAVAALVLIAPIILPLIPQLQSSNPNSITTPALAEALVQLIPNIILLIIISIIVEIFIIAIYADFATKWQDQEVSLVESVAVAGRRFLDLILFSVVVYVIEIILFLVIFSPTLISLFSIGINGTASQTAPAGFGLSLVISFLLAIIAIIILAPLLFTGAPFVVIEKEGPITALKSSIAVGRKNFLSIIVLLILSAIVYTIIYFVSLVFHLIPVLGGLITFLVSVVLATFLSLISPIYYLMVVKPKTQQQQQAAHPKRRQRTTK